MPTLHSILIFVFVGSLESSFGLHYGDFKFVYFYGDYIFVYIYGYYIFVFAVLTHSKDGVCWSCPEAPREEIA